MPWVPELFSAPVLERVLAKRRQTALVAMPFFDGLIAGEPDALIESFAGDPELHDPIRGRIEGVQAFKAYVAEMSAWLADRSVSIEDVDHVVLEGRGFEELVLHLDGDAGRVELPFALVADRRSDGRIRELRLYYGSRLLTGRHTVRPPLLQPDPAVHPPDVVAAYQRALAAGDVDAVVATFAPDGYARVSADGGGIHRGPDDLRSFYGLLLASDGAIALQPCALVDDGRACALEFNMMLQRRPQAGVAVFVRGHGGRLDAVRVYDDAEPPPGPGIGGASTYVLDHRLEGERARLALMSRLLDPMHRRHIEALAVGAGARALEVGCGNGSVSAWLAERVGPGGRAVAADLDLSLIDARAPNLELREADIVAAPIDPGSFDLVTARAVLHHVSDADAAIENLVAGLAPGGAILLIEPDFLPVSVAEPADVRAFWDGWLAWSRDQGIDYHVGRTLAPRLAALGLEMVAGTAETAVYHGGSPWADYWTQTVVELRDQLLASGRLDDVLVDRFLAECRDPRWWTQTIAFTAVHARAPGP